MEDFSLNVYRLHPNGVRITPAEKTLNGTAHPGGVKYCGPFTQANAAGFWVFPAADIDIMWTGEEFEHKMVSQYTDSDYHFVRQLIRPSDHVEPDDWCIEGGRTKYSFGAVEPNIVQIWTGCIFQTPPGWNLHVRSPINFPRQPFSVMEGILETDWMQYDIWINFAFYEKNKWVEIRRDSWPPIAQLIPVHRDSSSDKWEIKHDEMIDRDNAESNRVFEYWAQYNHKKYSSGGKQALSQFDPKLTKDATTFYRERKRIMDRNTELPKEELMEAKAVCPYAHQKVPKKFLSVPPRPKGQ